MKKQDYQATSWLHRMAADYLHEGAVCVDATMGNGYDTEFLCRNAGKKGRVIAFDIQEEAITHTKDRLFQNNIENACLILESHVLMPDYVDENSADLIMFNLGYLPGGNHQICTKAETTIPALEGALTLLKKGGAICMLVYSGGDTGTSEKEAVLEWLKTLDSKEYLVILNEFFNRPNNPPVAVLIVKLPEE